MPNSSLIDEIHRARTRWLSGDADAWRRYLACCHHLESELKTAPRDVAEDTQTGPRAIRRRAGRGTTRRRAGRGTTRRRGRRAPSTHL